MDIFASIKGMAMWPRYPLEDKLCVNKNYIYNMNTLSCWYILIDATYIFFYPQPQP